MKMIKVGIYEDEVYPHFFMEEIESGEPIGFYNCVVEIPEERYKVLCDKRREGAEFQRMLWELDEIASKE